MTADVRKVVKGKHQADRLRRTGTQRRHREASDANPIKNTYMARTAS